jgi:holo-ACP synthase
MDKISDGQAALNLLDAREERVNIQNDLLKKYNNTLICARINYPGIYKDNELTRGIMSVVKKEIISSFESSILYQSLSYTAEGPCFMIIVSLGSEDAKLCAVKIEDEHPLGRFTDIDVYRPDGSSLSRSQFGLESRKCYLCDDTAHNCVRSRKHSINEVIGYMEKKYDEYCKSV